ncbi:signal peptide peptidase SppA [Shewanella sp. JNE10-2]|uniref:signal peptide peptidase SppA n=1 Tax=unclassified Shewanella TaxID=196818 RepID=UPI002006310E|nr:MULTISPECIES: signal peptide peptidase SppA [unclassified Shewanella]MCK7629274.1 signal peptide peptidase SppA [Shewanella sp. JNE9-1]MCK7634170.1 signal peptide peptidase SppA [Shewanella sp. JNE17]MCK7644344.1 signal peptide peptidase SppA [Shewanella sp. JNE3-1]MCK7649395.1 signal peptide peptidase SppA [Shewanella sp. JNE8]MCK7652580.1 signal peptide peptidase SppA [Shewanella sp. JNE4-1]
MSANPSFFKRICLFIWNILNGTRKLILNLIFFGILAVIMISITAGEDIQVEDNSALVLNLAGSIVDQKQQIDPIEAALKQGNKANADGEILLADVLYVIDNAAQDTRITTLVLDLADLKRAGISKLQSIGNAINRFKESGKQVVAIGNYYEQNQYFLASFADTIYLNPQGGISLDGLSMYNLYFKSALEKLKIKAHIFRVGTFKSAVEPYMRDDMSDAAKEANSALLADVWQSYTQTVANNRNIDASALVLDASTYLAELDKAQGDSATMAINMKWVDSLATAEDFRKTMIDTVGKAKSGDSFKQISFYDYLTLVAPKPSFIEQDSVGIIVASGTILNGKQPAGQIGGDSTAELLRKARFDKHIKALVLRVDSPGGSAFASEQIRQELLALKAAGKPVVVSMGSLAASGGYWISASADYIFATPTTLTGSIGIFGMITTFEDSLDSIGIHTDGVSTSEWAGLSVTRTLSSSVEAVIQSHIERGYLNFISLVAKERNMTLEQVDSIAQGRVWSGKKALELGLVDELGDIDEAIAKAAKLANLNLFDTRVIEQELTPEQLFIQQMFASVSSYLPASLSHSSVLEQMLQQWTGSLKTITSFNDPNHVYIYCDNCELLN